jgi:predicted hydrolase (HD superfamily)
MGENIGTSLQSRESAWGLLTEYTQSDSLRKHARAVEACMRAYAQKFARDNGLNDSEAAELEHKYSIAGLLHDFDYEQFPTPELHPFVGSRILAERGYPEEIRRCILSHADYANVPRETHMEKVLFACDELAGFITATALVKPSKSLAEVDAKSIRKKMKDKAFARSVSREDITNGAADLGVDLDEHIAFCIEAMKKIAPDLGL